VEELDRKKKQIPELRVEDLMAIFETSIDPKEIIWVGFEINRRKTGAPYKMSSIDWASESWYPFLEEFPQYQNRILKSLRTRLRNLVRKGKKVVSIYYFPDFLMEQIPYSYSREEDNGYSNNIGDYESFDEEPPF
jgi:hypothetical protein